MPIRTTAPTRAAVTAAALIGALALTACGSTPPPAAPPTTTDATPTTTASPPTTVPTTTPPATAAAPATAADGTNYGACRDGRCTVQVSSGTSIRFPSSLGISSFRVKSVDAGTVSFVVEYSSGSIGLTSSSRGGTGRFNGLNYRILDVRGSTAIVEFTTG